jgi:hypothetical protein
MTVKPAILLLATVVTIAACGSSALTAGEYFEAVESSAAEYDAATDGFLDDYTAAVGPASIEFEANSVDADTATLAAEKAKFIDTLVSEMSLFFERGGDALESFVDTLNGLDPPEDVEAAHNEAVATLTRSLDAIPDLVGELRSADSQQEIDEAINGSDFGDVQPRVAAACVALQEVAVTQGITVDLHCGDPE